MANVRALVEELVEHVKSLQGPEVTFRFEHVEQFCLDLESEEIEGVAFFKVPIEVPLVTVEDSQ